MSLPDRQPVDQGRHADCVIATAGWQNEADEIAQSITQRPNLGGHVALGAAYDLTLSLQTPACSKSRVSSSKFVDEATLPASLIHQPI